MVSASSTSAPKLKLKQILPSWLSEHSIVSIEFVHIGIKNVKNIGPL